MPGTTGIIPEGNTVIVESTGASGDVQAGVIISVNESTPDRFKYGVTVWYGAAGAGYYAIGTGSLRVVDIDAIIAREPSPS